MNGTYFSGECRRCCRLSFLVGIWIGKMLVQSIKNGMFDGQ